MVQPEKLSAYPAPLMLLTLVTVTGDADPFPSVTEGNAVAKVPKLPVSFTVLGVATRAAAPVPLTAICSGLPLAPV